MKKHDWRLFSCWGGLEFQTKDPQIMALECCDSTILGRSLLRKKKVTSCYISLFSSKLNKIPQTMPCIISKGLVQCYIISFLVSLFSWPNPIPQLQFHKYAMNHIPIIW